MTDPIVSACVCGGTIVAAGDVIHDYDVERAVKDHNETEQHRVWRRAPQTQAEELMRDALVGMVQQFAYWADAGPQPGLWTGGLSALEDAFDALGWDDPHPEPSMQCDEPGCKRQSTCGWPSRPGGTGLNGGYRRTCGDHMRQFYRATSAPERMLGSDAPTRPDVE